MVQPLGRLAVISWHGGAAEVEHPGKQVVGHPGKACQNFRFSERQKDAGNTINLAHLQESCWRLQRQAQCSHGAHAPPFCFVCGL